jgi:hypothetical protein
VRPAPGEPVGVAPPLPGVPSGAWRPGYLHHPAKKSRFLDDFLALAQNRSLLVIVAVLVLAATILGFIIGCCIIPVGHSHKRSEVEALLSDSLHSDNPYREYAPRKSSGPSSYGVPELTEPSGAFLFV